MATVLSDTIIEGNLGVYNLRLLYPVPFQNGGLAKDLTTFGASSLLRCQNGLINEVPLISSSSGAYYDFTADNAAQADSCVATNSLMDYRLTTRTIYITYKGSSLNGTTATVLGYYNLSVKPVSTDNITAGRTNYWRGYNNDQAEWQTWTVTYGSDPSGNYVLAIL